MTSTQTDTVAEPRARETRTIDVVDPTGAKVGTVDLPGEVFDAPLNVPLIHQVVVAQLAAARQGTHSTRTRGRVRGGGKKPYRQKGTGNARQGSIRAPQYKGGGTVHGPQPRDYTQHTPKKMKRGALYSALSDRARAGRIHVASAIVELPAPSTKAAKTALAAIAGDGKILVVLPARDALAQRSVRNLPTVHALPVQQLNTYDVVDSDHVVFTSAALSQFLGEGEEEQK